MLKSYNTVLTKDLQTIICDVDGDKEFCISSISVYGGETGGNITFDINGFKMTHTVSASDTIHLPFTLNVVTGSCVYAKADNDGLLVTVSGEEFESDNPIGTPLTFTLAHELDSTPSEIRIKKTGTLDNIEIYYRYKNLTLEWSPVTFGSWYSLNKGDVLQFQSTTETFSKNNANYIQITALKGKVCAKGNVLSLINYKTVLPNYCFKNLFYDCTSLTQAPNLPATTLSSYCYSGMFYGCTSLTQAPNLPATTLSSYCYSNMFYGCTSLTQAPNLPVTTLADGCYSSMFARCTNLTQAPNLPATTLADGCYSSMFTSCTSLIQAPNLPATTLAANCYSSMFDSCTSLTQAPNLPATTLSSHCYSSMFARCTNLTQAPNLPATTLANNCYNSMFASCTSLTQAPNLPATTLDSMCYYKMFGYCTSLNNINVSFTKWTRMDNAECTEGWTENVASTGTFYCPKALTKTYNTTSSFNRIPKGWTVVNID